MLYTPAWKFVTGSARADHAGVERASDGGGVRDWTVWLHAGMVLAIGILLYIPSLRIGFQADDFVFIDPLRRYSLIEALQGVKQDGFDNFFRPLVHLSFAVDAVVWGQRPIGYHLTNLALHLTNSLLVLCLTRARWSSGQSLAISLLFLVHPIHNEAVLWISGRSDLLCASFVLASLLAAVRSSAAGALASTSLFVLALCSKETAIVTPLALAAACPVVSQARRRWLIRVVAITGVVAILYVVWRSTILPLSAYQTPYSGFGWGTPAKVAYYATGLLTGISTEVIKPLLKLYYPAVFVGAAAVLAVAAVACWFLKPRFEIGRSEIFFACLLVAFLLPVLGLSAERYLYLPSVGFCALSVRFARTWSRRKVLLAAGGAGCWCVTLVLLGVGNWTEASRIAERFRVDAARALEVHDLDHVYCIAPGTHNGALVLRSGLERALYGAGLPRKTRVTYALATNVGSWWPGQVRVEQAAPGEFEINFIDPVHWMPPVTGVSLVEGSVIEIQRGVKLEVASAGDEGSLEAVVAHISPDPAEETAIVYRDEWGVIRVLRIHREMD